MYECSKADCDDPEVECCAAVGDTCEHTSDCHWRVTDYLDGAEVRWCDTHECEHDLITDR